MSARSLVFLAVACAACSPPHARSKGPAQRVILVTCDTLRADHLGTYGYARPTSPSVDAFARDSVVFEEAYSSAPMTGPSLASLLSGLLPDELGLATGNRWLIGADVVTLPEVLRDASFPTAAVVSNWVLRRQDPKLGDCGVQQGFAHFDDRMERREANRDTFERLAPDTTDAAIARLEALARAGEPSFFLWVHYQDPHGPYTPPADSLAQLDSAPLETADLPASLPLGTTQKGLGQIPQYQAVAERRAPEDYLRRYDGEVRSFDAQFGRLVDWLRAHGWYDDALIVFTADHGESLGEHGYWFCHGENVQREEVRVPLVVKYPEGAQRPAQARVRELATHLDLWPTVLEAFGVAPRPNRGISLFRAELPRERVSSQVLGAPRTPERQVGASDGRLRLVQSGTGAPRLFDVVADPREEHDLAPTRPLDAQQLAERLERWVHSLPAASHVPVRMPSTTANRRALEGFGYTGDEEH